MNTFETLFAVNVNSLTEKKKTGNAELTYLSWPFAWAEVKKRYPDASYEIEKFNGLPYAYDAMTGYMVYTTVTIENTTHEMWLPVMDGANKAMKSEPYKYQTRYGEKVCESATMFDINKTIMRCLVKNLAMFGLGLYIYAGEDLPITDDPTENVKDENIDATMINALMAAADHAGVTVEKICKQFELKSLSEMTVGQFRECRVLLEEYTRKTKGKK